jgi:hypothetical protein
VRGGLLYVVMLAINVSPKTLASLPPPPPPPPPPRPVADNAPSPLSVAEFVAMVAVSDKELSKLLMKVVSEEAIIVDVGCDCDCDCGCDSVCAVSGSVRVVDAPVLETVIGASCNEPLLDVVPSVAVVLPLTANLW